MHCESGMFFLLFASSHEDMGEYADGFMQTGLSISAPKLLLRDNDVVGFPSEIGITNSLTCGKKQSHRNHSEISTSDPGL